MVHSGLVDQLDYSRAISTGKLDVLGAPPLPASLGAHRDHSHETQTGLRVAPREDGRGEERNATISKTVKPL